MNLKFDDWHDWARLCTFFVCVASIVLLIYRYRLGSRSWNAKMRDYWFALIMWSAAGCVITFEGVVNDRAFGIRAIFVIAASTVTLLGLFRGDKAVNDD